MAEPSILVADGWTDHALLDSGDGWKLEQVGGFRFARPEPQALWRSTKAVGLWRFDARFSPAADEAEEQGRWRLERELPQMWPVAFDGLRFYARCTPFRHLGFFPEQSVQWSWMAERLGPGSSLLNLFGYTGVASLFAARAGAAVTHVDASKKAIAFAKQNQQLAGLETATIRWIVDDALAFVKREARRGKVYDGVLLDPPKFGRGPNGEVWRLEEQFWELLTALQGILAPAQSGRPAFVIATLYALRLSHLALGRTLAAALDGCGGAIEAGEMCLREANGRLLPTALFARWTR